MLQRPELADLVIPDLAKWEDWSVMDKLFELFKTANDKNSWVRVPVVNYLRSCPLPKAKELLNECEKIDPAAVRRANMFPSAVPAPAAEKSSQLEPAASLRPVAAIEPQPMPMGGAMLAMSGPPAPPADSGEQIASALNQGVSLAVAVRKTPAPSPNLAAILGVPWGVGAALLLVQWSLLRGRHS
jgi:hypothetical protein